MWTLDRVIDKKRSPPHPLPIFHVYNLLFFTPWLLACLKISQSKIYFLQKTIILCYICSIINYHSLLKNKCSYFRFFPINSNVHYIFTKKSIGVGCRTSTLRNTFWLFIWVIMYLCNFISRELSSLSGFSSLRHLDLQLISVRKVGRGHSESSRGHLLDGWPLVEFSILV